MTLYIFGLLSLLLGVASALPVSQDADGALVLAGRADSYYIRDMPLGASITVGYRSSDDNGYRKTFRDHLTSAGWKVNMVGSYTGGNMTDKASLTENSK
jgi:hypothetical protein